MYWLCVEVNSDRGTCCAVKHLVYNGDSILCGVYFVAYFVAYKLAAPCAVTYHKSADMVRVVSESMRTADSE
jgi:hypothetical protein